MHGAYRHTDPETSKEAAQFDVTRLEGEVYAVLRIQPSTAEEIAQALGKALPTVTPRFAPLKRKGLIYDTGERRPGASGRSRIVYAAATEIIPQPKKSRKLEEKEILQIARGHTKYMTGSTAWAMDVVSFVRTLETKWGIK